MGHEGQTVMIVASLASGDRLGPYEILRLIGRGGMGEVYLGRDTTLNREVALKVLPDRHRLDAQRLARFDREARILASLNHPNIATLHGRETSSDFQALVMEFVDGDTLAECLCAEPLPLDRSLRIARQIVDALDSAHAHGIIHRDLKPDNVKVRPDGTVKVLDFGLAKAYEANEHRDARYSTVTVAPEHGQALIGTMSYTSPEQTRGLEVDTRADIWSFGCVLFEMITGRRAFDGPTNSDVIAAVLDREPDWTSLPATTPARVRRVLRRCLEKDAGRRLRHIADARADLEDAETEHDLPAPAQTRMPSYGRLAIAGAVVTAVAAGFFLGTRGQAPSTSIGPTQFVLLPPEGTAFGAGVLDRTPSVAIAPDGTRVAFVATDRAGRRQLWIRPIRSFTAEPLAGTDGAGEHFWSPDGAFIGFFADGKLKKVAVSGGTVTTLADASNGSGGTWSRNGVILFAPSTQSGLFRVPASGGAATPVTAVEAPGEYGHVYPQFLPDGRHFLYLDRALPERKGIYIGSLDDTSRTRIIEARERARFALPDRLLFLREGRLMSQRLDPRTFQISGDPVAVADSVAFIATDGRASYDVSDDGVLVYRANGLLAASQPVVVDRAGRTIETVGEPGDYQTARFSPDGSTIATERHDLRTSTGDLWLIDLNRGSTSRLTFDGMHNNRAVWSPDGRRVVFTGRPDGVRNLHLKDVGAERDEPLLTPGPDRNPSDWSADGLRILYSEGTAPKRDIWYLSLSDQRPMPYLRTDFDEWEARFSPNGRWVAYQSDETGKSEVYVRSFPYGGGKRQISANGGEAPRWSRDGRELFFVGHQSVQGVQVQTDGPFTAGVPRVLFTADLRSGPATTAEGWFDVSGQRFLIVPNPPGPMPPALPITVMLNWARR